MSAKSKQQLEQTYSKLNEQYNSLLQKNQNDLIKIRQKQKTFNETIQSLKLERQQAQKKYKGNINSLMLQLQKMKSGHQQNNKKQQKSMNKQNEEVIKALKEQISVLNIKTTTFKQIIDQKTERVEHLEQNARKLIDENINLTASYQQLKKQTKQLQQKLKVVINESLEVKKLSHQHHETKKQVANEQVQTQGDFVISYKQHNALIEKFNQQINLLNKEIQQKQQSITNVKGRLRQTNEQLKRFMERDKKNTVLLKKRSEQIQNLQLQIQSTKKTHKTERKRVATQQSCGKCKEWEQESKLLKQMVKSMQTMVRVRELQAQRYKNREALHNSKVHQKLEQPQSKKSRGQLPPLGKRN